MKISRIVCLALACLIVPLPTLGGGSDNPGDEDSISNIDDFSNVPRRVIVQFDTDDERDWDEVADHLSELTGRELGYLRKLAAGNRHVFRLAQLLDESKVRTLLQRIAEKVDILSVELDALMQRSLAPDDDLFSNQWHYYEPTGGINAADAWDQQDGTGIVVAVIDTGYLPHSDLDANMLFGFGYDFISETDVANDGGGRDADATDAGDWLEARECGILYPLTATDSSWHGTHVAGTIAAVTNNNAGVSGVAFGARVLPVRALGKCGGYVSDIADAIVWASGGSVPGVPANQYPADVINMSLGGSGNCSIVYQAAINEARANGTTVVVAAGNNNDNAVNYQPANCAGVINVAANDREGNRASYSNYGATVDVTAPGGESDFLDGVLSTLNSGSKSPGEESYDYYQGTSMATPHVAGAAALLLAEKPDLTPDQVERVLKATARPLPGNCSGGCGAGIIDASAALAAVSEPVNTDDGPVDLSGNVQNAAGIPLCSLVLASGRGQFSCDPDGPFSLANLPRETDGSVKRQVYVDGFFPRVDVLQGSTNEPVVMQKAGTCSDYNTPYNPGAYPGSAGDRLDISGRILLQDSNTPICALVLANGQYQFSCDGNGNYSLNIPLDTNGQYKLQIYADGFAPTIKKFDEFQATNDVRMARAVECQ